MNISREREECHSSVSGSTAASVSDQKISDNIQYYLPTFASRIALCPSLQRIGFSAEKVPKNGSMEYTFNVSWTDVSKEAFRAYNDLKKPVTVKSSSLVSLNSVDYPIRCDGPCGKKYEGDVEIHQFGICDHNICSSCYANAPNIPLFDGTPGCCNLECYRNDHYYVYSSPSGEADSAARLATVCSTRSSTSCTSTGVAELLLVRVLFFRKVNGRVDRQKTDREINSRIRMKDYYKFLQDTIPCLDKCEIFFTPRDNFRRNDLVPLSASWFDKRSLYTVAQGSDVVNLVVVAPGVALFK